MLRLSFGAFSLEVASDWTLSTVILTGPVEKAPPDMRVLSVMPPKQFQQNIVVTMEQVSASETPEGYAKKQLEGLLKAGVSRLGAAPPERVKLNSGLDGLLTDQVIMGAEGQWVHQIQLMSIKDGTAFTVIASQLDGEPYQRVRDTFRKILLSFSPTTS
jgi:hypothetical protein